MKYLTHSLLVLLAFLAISCQKTQRQSSVDTEKLPFALRFIGEKRIDFKTKFGSKSIEEMTIGGLSGIDYDQEKDIYYLISDDLYDENGRLRFYTAKLFYNESAFDSLEILSTNLIKQANGNFYPLESEGKKQADPESIRFSDNSKTLLWTSEGDRRQNIIIPFLAEMDTIGNHIQKITLPTKIIDTTQSKGWYHNAAIEAMDLSSNEQKIWLMTENPLQQDGEEAKNMIGTYPVRLIQLDRQSAKLEKEYVYLLEPVSKEPIPRNNFGMNGIVEILEWEAGEKAKILTLERSFSMGYPEGKGVTARLFLAETEGATTIQNLESLKDLTPNQDYIPLKKTLIVDLEDFGLEHIDNIEGITYGKRLPNGNKTLIFVSDNNFLKSQITQLLVFEIIEL